MGDVLRIAVFASGNGGNLQSLLNACEERTFGAKVVVAISDRPGTMALQRAENYHVPCVVLDHGNPNIASILVECLRYYEADLVVLAGYRKLLPADVISFMKDMVINIHPALDLKRFGGPGMIGDRVHKAVLEAGEEWSGCTVHFADNEYDHGPILLQGRVPVRADDTVETLSQRVRTIEYILLPQAVEMVRKVYLAPPPAPAPTSQ